MKNNGYYHTFYKKQKVILKIAYDSITTFQAILDQNKENILIWSRKKHDYILFNLWNKKEPFKEIFFDKLKESNIYEIKDYYEWKMLNIHLLKDIDLY